MNKTDLILFLLIVVLISIDYVKFSSGVIVEYETSTNKILRLLTFLLFSGFIIKSIYNLVILIQNYKGGI